MLASGGTCVMFGATGGAEVSFNASQFYPTGGAKLYGLIIFKELLLEPPSIGLKVLVDLLAAGQLKPHIDVEISWNKVAEIAQQLMDRKFLGKAVLTVD
jgi:NADPH:quinone reductase-like Zn-dependent oxidoreductase